MILLLFFLLILNCFKNITIFQKAGGSLGTQGSASHNFNQLGVIRIDKKEISDELDNYDLEILADMINRNTIMQGLADAAEFDEITKKENYSNIVALSARFGVRLGFFENNKENYLKIVQHYANVNGISLKKEHIIRASEWSLEKGNFSGRTAYQFILTLKNN